MPEPVTATTIVTAAATPFIKRMFENLANALSKQAGKLTQAIIDKTVTELRIGFDDYLASSYVRCAQFKTILNPHEPLRIDTNYIHVTLSCGKQSIKDDDLVIEAHKIRYVVVTGLAGCGKSMFMKYLTMSAFTASERIPLLSNSEI